MKSIKSKISLSILTFDSIFVVLNSAYDEILKINPNVISGEERSFLKVHLKDTDIAKNGEKIIVKDVCGKDTYFVESQILYK